MMRFINPIWFVLLILSFGCKPVAQQDTTSFDQAFYDEHNSFNALDWAGVYTGTLPCADCNGIQTKLEIDYELNYTLTTKYLGKSETENIEHGIFTWNDAGSTITLQNKDKPQYFVGENFLRHLDNAGNKITGKLAEDYILNKIIDMQEKRWILTSLYGNPVSNTNADEPLYFVHNSVEQTIHGYSGCNSFMGNYELLEDDKINIGSLGLTKMLCEDDKVNQREMRLIEAFHNTVTFHKDGNQLTLLDSDNNVLAEFISDMIEE